MTEEIAETAVVAEIAGVSGVDAICVAEFSGPRFPAWYPAAAMPQ
jgi:hypothetical protein